MSQCRRRIGEMRDKENRKDARKATKPSHSVKPLAPTQANTPNKPSRVRRVPDFNKLHKSFQLQIEKAKKNKQVTEFKTFDLTPAVKQSVKDKRSSKRVKEEQEKGKEENGSEEKDEDKGTTVGFEPRPDCLQAILHNQPILEPPQTPTNIGSLERGQPRVMGVALSPGRQIRLSVYTKRDRTLRKLLQSKASDGTGLVSAAATSCPRASEFSQLLQGMVQSTATTLRTVSHLARDEGTRGREEVELDGVKLRLESQLEEAAEETMATGSQPNTRLCHTLTPLTKSHPLSDTHPLDHHLSLPLCKPSFYHEEPELRAIVWRTAVCKSELKGEKRPTCPLASLLDQCYITSLTDMISTKEN